MDNNIEQLDQRRAATAADEAKAKLNETGQTARNKASDMSGAAKDKAADMSETVKDKAADMSETVKDKASEAGGVAKNKVSELGGRAKEVLSDPKQRQAKQADAEEWIRRNPLRATGIAFAVGYRLSRMMHKR